MAKRISNKRNDSKRTPEAKAEAMRRRALRKFHRDNQGKY